nr:murein transglycosylase domain-containing protein [Thiomicrorhabdus cannonii]
MKRVIARVLLSAQPFNDDLLSRKSLDYQKTPYFYRQVLDQHRQPIRYPANAFDYADYLFSSKQMEKIVDEEGAFTVVSIPLVKADYPKPVQKYKDWVAQYARDFKVEPALVFAVMETESRFKPDAVSRSNALGLMQLKADAAGRDIYQRIDQKPGMPNAAELFDERNNIRMGTAYLGLLKHEYLAEVHNLQNKEMLSIASYNGGLSTVLKLFGDSPEAAIKRINQLHPKQVYRKLRFEHASRETRDYLDKVLKAKSRYQHLLSA